MKYNAFFIDKVIIIRIKDIENTRVEKRNNITIMYHNEDIIGYNIFNVESDLLTGGLLKQSEELNDLINNELKKEDLPLLEVDNNKYFIVGYVKECTPFKDSKKLHLCQVDLKEKMVQIVCGSINIKQDIKVVVALPNAVFKDGTWIKDGKVMNVESHGMICSDKELGLSEVSHGAYIVGDDYMIGDSFFD
ncbi:MAG: DUF4479 domain-containing protein [Bacilli bacterium]|jgi:tRNA-binding protein|nr:DUF4479 domain-containing protein [Bacilli bacterium]